MARQRVSEAPSPPNGFVASATALPAIRPRSATSTQGWQLHGWSKYDCVAELRYIANWRGAAMSRAKLMVVHDTSAGLQKVEAGPAFDALATYFAGPQGQSQMLHATGVNHTVAGEAYHVYLADRDEYCVLSCDAVTQHNKKVTALIEGERVPIGSSDLCVRIWTPHPRNIMHADSPVRSNLGTLDQITRLNEHIDAQLDSRLTGAGIVFLPSEIQFPVPEGMDPQAHQADAFMQTLTEAMTTAVKERGSAAATVPIVVTAPGESLEKPRRMTFWSELDAAVITMLDNAIRRFALGMDVPPEVLLGTTESNHWGAWIVDEAAIKTHLEPSLAVISHAITTAYLRPAITDEVPDPQNYFIVADTSSIRLRPNRSSEAIELFDRGALSADALRRETGFETGDQPNQTEFAQWLLRKVATGTTDPAATVAALKQLGVDLGPVSTGQPERQVGKDARRQVRDRREPDIPRAIDEKKQREIQRSDGLTAACDVLVHHALTRVGHKLSGSRNFDGLASIPVRERHLVASGDNPDRLLNGAWDFAGDVLDGVHESPEAVVTMLDLYVRGLIAAKLPHTRDGLALVLRQLDEVAV